MNPAMERLDYQRLFEALPARFLVLLPDAPRYTMLAASDALLQMVGLRRQDLLGHGVFERFPGDPSSADNSGPERFRASLARVQETGRIDTLPLMRYDMPAPNAPAGTFVERWWLPVNAPVFDADGQLRYILHGVDEATRAVLDAQTERERSESLQQRVDRLQADLLRHNQELAQTNRALTDSEQRYRYTIRSVPGVLWTANADGELEFVSDSSVQSMGIESRSLLGTGWQQFVDPAHRDQALARWQQAVDAGEAYDDNFRLIDPQGVGRWYQARAQCQRDGQGRGQRWYGITINIDEVVLARQRAEEATRAKSAFLATMSHEIRTPLNAVLGFAGLLADTPLGAQQRDFLQSIRASGDHLLGVINDILDYSRLESGSLPLDYGRCELRALIDTASDMVASQAAAKGLRLTWGIDDAVPAAIHADASRLRQVLANLLGNAVKFTLAGEVELRVSMDAGAAGHTAVRFTVRDTGIGIAEHQLPRLFRDFSQVDDGVARSFGGTGLGLAISKRLVEAHGGSIEVHSTVGVGSRFSAIVPARLHALPPPPARAAVTATAAPETNAPPPLRLLLAEDNLVNRKVAQLVLRKLGYADIDIATDGLEALAAVHARAYDVVLMDVQMPNLDGLDATRRIRAEVPAHHQPQILAMTANALAEDREACTSAGMDDYVPKPIEPLRLSQALLAAAARRGIAAAPPLTRVPGPHEQAEARARVISQQLFADSGEMSQRMRAMDWSQTPLGPIYTWPLSLRTALSILLSQKHPMFLWWGPDLVQFYNDAYRPILGRSKHPAALGQHGRECFAEVWDTIGPVVDAVTLRGESHMVDQGQLCLDRHGFVEECYFNYGYSPIRDDSGGIGGVFVACSEVSETVVGARRTQLLLALDEARDSAAGLSMGAVQHLLAGATHDLPFVLLYRRPAPGAALVLRLCCGLAPGSSGAPEWLDADASSPWPANECLRTQMSRVHRCIVDLPVLPPWPESPSQGCLVPLDGDTLLIAGLSPRLHADAGYQAFVKRVAQQLSDLDWTRTAP